MTLLNSIVESNRSVPISCGYGIRKVSEEWRCLYDVDDEFNEAGCITLNHLDNCSETKIEIKNFI
jgi:hypothetical protein